MAFTLADFEAKANATYKGLDVDSPDGTRLFTLRSSLRLSDAESLKLQDAQTILTSSEKDEDGKDKEVRPSDLKRQVVAVLSILSDNPQACKEFCRSIDLAVVMSIMTIHAEQTQAAEGN